MFKEAIKKFYALTVFAVLALVQGREKVFAEEDGLFLGKITGDIYNLIYPVAILYGVFEIIIAGYRIMKSEGEPKALMDAKSHLTDSIIGIIFVMLAAVILKVIMKSFLAQDLDF
jgi:hypothetical protein